MLWNVDYTIDYNYVWYEEHCVIKADTEDDAKEFFMSYMERKLQGERFIVDKVTITKAPDKPIIYDSWNG